MESIANKIRKIIAKADGTTHAEEASSFMEMAHRLMEQHGLSLLDIGRLDEDDPLGREDAISHGAGDMWKSRLATYVARYFGCEAVSLRSRRRCELVIYGRQSARTTFSLMWPFIQRQVMALARRDRDLYSASGDTRIARRQIAGALIHRLNGMIEDRRRSEDRGEGTKLGALVPVDLIDAMVSEDFPHIRTRNSTITLSSASVRAAGEVSLAMQADGRATRRIT